MSTYINIDEKFSKLNKEVKNKKMQLHTLRDTLLYEENISAEERQNYEKMKNQYLNLYKEFNEIKNYKIEAYKKIDISKDKEIIFDLKEELRELFIKIKDLDNKSLLMKKHKTEYFIKKKKINEHYKNLKVNIEKLKNPIFQLKK